MLFKDTYLRGNYKGEHGNDYHNVQGSGYMGGRGGNKVKKEDPEDVLAKYICPAFIMLYFMIEELTNQRYSWNSPLS